jgi:hypothetical protein
VNIVLKRSLALVSRWWLVAVLAGIVAVTNQYWVGGATVYAEQNRERQAEAHEAILANELPAGVESWSSIGANGTAVRVLAVWSASALQGLTGWNLRRVYFVQDSVMLFLALVLIFLFFQGVAATNLAFVGMLYVAAVLPLTYFLHWFHPWDRPSLVLWALALLLLQRQRWVLLGVTLVVGVLVKYDIMIFPLWVLFAEFSARKPFRAFAIAGTLATVTFGTYATLVYLIPGACLAMTVIMFLKSNFPPTPPPPGGARSGRPEGSPPGRTHPGG